MRTGTAPGPQPDRPGAPARLPADTRVGAVHLQVADLQRSVAYYEGVLGLELLQCDNAGASLGPGGGTPLVHLVERAGAAPVPRRGRFGLFHFALLLPNRGSLGRFLAHLLRLGVRPGSADHAVSEALYLTDPDGLGIEVYADRPRTSWPHRGDEIVMTTEPLDVAGLLDSGGGADWSGAPNGTTMGHVHLHVGDLAEAEAFYSRAVGFDRAMWSYPGALFLSAGGYHHHLGTNTWSAGPSAHADEAKLIEWELLLPARDPIADVIDRLRAAGYTVSEAADGVRASDPWGTPVHIRLSESG